MSKNNFPYLHGFTSVEQERLRKQALFLEHLTYQDVDFSEARDIIEVGCGVGAQSEILLRRFPHINLTGVEISEKQLKQAKSHLGNQAWAKGRYQLHLMDAHKLDFKQKFDAAFFCWVLEHMPKPLNALKEVKKVLKPGATIYLTEVMNHTFFLDPYSPNVWKYWLAFNDYQFENAGDPFIGVKLGNLLKDAGFSNIQTQLKNWFLDKRFPEQRKKALEFQEELLLSGAQTLIEAKYIDEETVGKMKQEFQDVKKNKDSVIYYTFVQARAKVLS